MGLLTLSSDPPRYNDVLTLAACFPVGIARKRPRGEPLPRHHRASIESPSQRHPDLLLAVEVEG